MHTEKIRINQRSPKNQWIRFAALFLVFALLTGLLVPVPAEASALKEEVVYVRLANDGSVEAVYVVNSFELDEERQIVDYGNYEYVQSLTGQGTVQLSNGTVSINSAGDRLHYEGFLIEPELPWTIAIAYELDGTEIAPAALAGKSGRLAIRINTAKNPNGDQDFFDTFALQLAVSLPSEQTRDIQAEGGTIAAAGENRQINFVALPGQESSLAIYADVTDFEMPAITIAGVRLNMDFDFDNVDLSDIRELSDGIAELDDGVIELADGVIELKDGTIELRDGVIELFDGTKELKDGTKELAKGTRDLKKGVKKASDGAKELKSNGPALAGGVDQYFDVILTMASAQLTASGLSAVTRTTYRSVIETALFGGELPETYAADDVYVVARQQYLNIMLATGIHGAIAPMSLADYKNLDPTNPAQAALKGDIDAAVDAAYGSAKPLLDVLKMLAGYDEINTGIAAYTAGVSRMSNGLVELYDGVDELHDGVVDLADGTSELHDGVEELVDGTKELADGVAELADGVNELADGTGELREETATLDRDILDGIKKEFDKMMGKGKKILSFVSGKNGEVSTVQFVMQTEGIKIDDSDTQPDWTLPQLSFWDRLVALFKRK
ncbi:MAG TPA: hypothetical protein GX688_03560 [Clostridiales bacterium]|nr:hypothetical protein [Clostridiales bacterium]